MKREWKTYAEKLGTWAESLKPLYDAGELDKITDKLQQRAQKKHQIIPSSDITYRAFLETPKNKVKVFIFGLCPYHTAVNRVTVADGLALSCSRTEQCAPSLEQWYGAIEKEFDDGLCLKCFRNPDLKFLAEQGVFLGNISLTTEYLKAGAHLELWEVFTTFFMSEVVGMMSDIPVVFLGREAEKYYPYLAPFQWQFLLSHPASASYDGTEWDSQGTFKKINKILKDQKKEEIKWIQEM